MAAAKDNGQLIPDGVKLVDWEAKGNVIRLHLGDRGLEDWHGDDWNDIPYDCNAGVVYDRFTVGWVDVAFPYDWDVMEPASNDSDCGFSKDDMKARRTPMFAVAPPDPDKWRWDWAHMVGDADATRIYMGDDPSTVTGIKGVTVLGMHLDEGRAE